MRRSVAGSKIQHYGKAAEKRKSLEVLIKVAVPNKKIFEDRIFFAVALNISASGILIESDKILTLGEKIKCTFILRRKIDVTGEIVRAVKMAEGVFKYEVRLFDIDPNARCQLEELGE